MEAAWNVCWHPMLPAANNAEAGASIVSAVLASGLPDVPLRAAGQMCAVAHVPGSAGLVWQGACAV